MLLTVTKGPRAGVAAAGGTRAGSQQTLGGGPGEEPRED